MTNKKKKAECMKYDWSFFFVYFIHLRYRPMNMWAVKFSDKNTAKNKKEENYPKEKSFTLPEEHRTGKLYHKTETKTKTKIERIDIYWWSNSILYMHFVSLTDRQSTDLLNTAQHKNKLHSTLPFGMDRCECHDRRLIKWLKTKRDIDTQRNQFVTWKFVLIFVIVVVCLCTRHSKIKSKPRQKERKKNRQQQQ